MTKTIFISFLMLTLHYSGFGQNNDSLNKKIDDENLYFQNDLYYQAVTTFVDSTFNNSTTDSIQVIFVKDRNLLLYLPKVIGKTKILFLWQEELKAQFDKFKKETMPIYCLTPILNDSNELYIGIRNFDYYYIETDGKITENNIVREMSFVTFIFDCIQNRFRPIEVLY